MEVRHLRKKFNKATIKKNQSSARKMYEKDRKTADQFCVQQRNVSEGHFSQMEVLIFKNNKKKNLLKVLGFFFLAFSYLCFLIISGKEGA